MLFVCSGLTSSNAGVPWLTDCSLWSSSCSSKHLVSPLVACGRRMGKLKVSEYAVKSSSISYVDLGHIWLA